jgi:hypothetical protein
MSIDSRLNSTSPCQIIGIRTLAASHPPTSTQGRMPVHSAKSHGRMSCHSAAAKPQSYRRAWDACSQTVLLHCRRSRHRLHPRCRECAHVLVSWSFLRLRLLVLGHWPRRETLRWWQITNNNITSNTFVWRRRAHHPSPLAISAPFTPQLAPRSAPTLTRD